MTVNKAMEQAYDSWRACKWVGKIPDLHDYATGDYIRPATDDECIASIFESPVGAFIMDNGDAGYVSFGRSA